MSEPKRVEVEGKTYRIELLTTEKAMAVFVRLTRLFGPSLGEIFTAEKGDRERAIGDAFSLFCQRLTTEDIAELRRTFGEVSWYVEDNKEILIDYGVQNIHFRGRPFALFRWLWACLQVNFADFFGAAAWLSELAGLRAKAQSSESPTG